MQDDTPMLWALKNLPEDLWARSQLCPRDRVLMLSATSSSVRDLLLIQRHWRVPTAVRVRRCASVETVAKGLNSLVASDWCSVVSLELVRGIEKATRVYSTGEPDDDVYDYIAPIKAAGARSLTEVLGQCSSITMLKFGRQ